MKCQNGCKPSAVGLHWNTIWLLSADGEQYEQGGQEMTSEWEFEKGRDPQGVACRGSRIYKGLLLLTSRAHSVKYK